MLNTQLPTLFRVGLDKKEEGQNGLFKNPVDSGNNSPGFAGRDTGWSLCQPRWGLRSNKPTCRRPHPGRLRDQPTQLSAGAPGRLF